MKTLVETPFVALLREYSHAHSLHDPDSLSVVFDGFVDTLIDKTKNRTSLLDLYRCLIYTRAEIVSLAAQSGIPAQPSGPETDAVADGVAVDACIQKALAILDAEVSIIRFSIEHPQVLTAIHQREPSLLFLSKKYTPTDLVELVSALFAAEVACYIDGRPAEAFDIGKEFGRMLNMEIKDFHVLKSKAISRKLRLTKFLDKLKCALIELSQR